MTKQRLIDNLIKLVVDCEAKLDRPTTKNVIETKQWIKEAIIEHGLYQRWSETEIVEHLQKVSIQELIKPLKNMWALQTSSEQHYGSAELINNKGFGGKKKADGTWTGDAAYAKKYMDYYMKYKELPAVHEIKIRKLLIKYRKQLTRIANNRAFILMTKRRTEKEHTMKIIDARWTPQINILLILCTCGNTFEHRADRWRCRCFNCHREERLDKIRDRK